MPSPSAAPRPCPTCSGPVGLAETNSTFTDRPCPTSLRPKRSPAASTVWRTLASWASARKKLMNPGPAISILRTRPCGSWGVARSLELHRGRRQGHPQARRGIRQGRADHLVRLHLSPESFFFLVRSAGFASAAGFGSAPDFDSAPALDPAAGLVSSPPCFSPARL